MFKLRLLWGLRRVWAYFLAVCFQRYIVILGKVFSVTFFPTPFGKVTTIPRYLYGCRSKPLEFLFGMRRPSMLTDAQRWLVWVFFGGKCRTNKLSFLAKTYIGVYWVYCVGTCFFSSWLHENKIDLKIQCFRNDYECMVDQRIIELWFFPPRFSERSSQQTHRQTPWVRRQQQELNHAHGKLDALHGSLGNLEARGCRGVCCTKLTRFCICISNAFIQKWKGTRAKLWANRPKDIKDPALDRWRGSFLHVFA